MTGSEANTSAGSPLAPALVAAAVVATFARAVPYPLQRSWDDGRFIIDNSDVHEVSLASLRSILGGPHFQAYHPLHLLSYWLDVPWVGNHAFVIHGVSLALWSIAAVLLYRVFCALALSVPAAALGALACVLHPAQVEAVSWATGRKDVLALLLVAAATLAHLRSTRFGDAAAWGSRGLYVLAALAKTTVLPLPLVWLAADVLIRRRAAKEALVHQVPVLALGGGLAAAVLGIWQQSEMVRMTAGGLGEAPARVAATVTHQLGGALWPAHNAPMYSTQALLAPGAGRWVMSGLLLVAVTVAALRGARRLLFALLAFAIFLLPVSNLIPMYYPFQDRYLSLPLVGLGFAVGLAVESLARAVTMRGAAVAGAVIIAALAGRTVQYQGAWSSELRLWGHAASVSPDAYYAWMKLGEVRRDAGDLHGAIVAYKRTLSVDPRIKLGHAALLQAVALRDEQHRKLSPSMAERYARVYFAALEDASSLRDLAARMLASGHLRTFELPMARALALSPMPDGVLERVAVAQFEAGRPTLGLFYVRQMKQPTQNPQLEALARRVAELQAASPL